MNYMSALMLRTSQAAILLMGAMHGATALAQTAPQDPPAAASDRDIIVTGSRLGRGGYDAPTPVNVVGDERLKQLSINNIADALNQIPSFRAIGTPASNFFRVSGNIGGRTMDLRGLGATRTLTLVDGRRFVAMTDSGTVDVNAIPSILVQRAEVVTGGASAAYGADAVAGVVNLLLDKKLNGFKADVNYGLSERGDARTFYMGAAGGFDFGGGRGHIVLGAEYSRETGIGPCEEREWCSRYTNYVPNPGYNNATRTSTNGLPATLVLDNVMFVYNENGILTGALKPNPSGTGTITLGQQLLNVGATSLPSVLRNKQFDASGNLVPYQFGNLLSGLLQQGRDPTQPFALGLSPLPLMVPTERFSSMIHGDYDLTDDIVLSGEFLYSRIIGGPAQASAPLEGPATIDINNPYISDATRATILAADPAITKLLVNTASWAIGGTNVSKAYLDTYRAALSLKGKLGNWDWDAYYTYGRVDGWVYDRNNRLKEWNDAWDVVAAPAGLPGIAQGTPICRTTVAKPGNGCIPMNLFGYGQISQAALDRYLVPEWQTRRYEQHVVSLNLRGSPFSNWAGDVKTAVGVEWRRDTAEGTADANTLAGNFISAQTTALPRTKTNVVEGYLEAGVPLMRDGVLGDSLDIDGAVRFTHYDRFGDATTWKGGVVYAPVPDLTFRVTRSRDIRAPTATESSPNATAILLPLPDPFIGGTTNQIVVTGGNPNLKLEKGDTFTAGIVLRPGFLPRFNLSLDYYDISVSGAIDSLTGTAIANACKQQSVLCNLIEFNANGSIARVFSNFQNLSKLHAEGLELVMDYRLPVLGGNVDIQLNGNYIVDLSTVGATGLVTRLDNWTGNNGSVTNIQGVPSWKLDGVVTYSREAWSVTAHGRYVPKALLDPTKIGPGQPGYDINNPNSININHVDSRFYLDLSARIKVPTAGGGFEVYGSVNNVFDKGEPEQLRLFGNPLHFDPIGRNFKLGVRANF